MDIKDYIDNIDDLNIKQIFNIVDDEFNNTDEVICNLELSLLDYYNLY